LLDRLLTLRRSTAVAALAAAVLIVASASSTLAAKSKPPTTQFLLPFDPGIEVHVTQGWNTTYTHHGISAYAYDFGLAEGTTIRAAASGIVSYVHAGETACGGVEELDHANLVTIDHPDGSATLYGHLSAVAVHVGEKVAAGQPIALSGKTGFTGCEAHLHFAREIQGGAVTSSIPIYFAGYPGRKLVAGDLVTWSGPADAAGQTWAGDLQAASDVPQELALDAPAVFVPKTDRPKPAGPGGVDLAPGAGPYGIGQATGDSAGRIGGPLADELATGPGAATIEHAFVAELRG